MRRKSLASRQSASLSCSRPFRPIESTRLLSPYSPDIPWRESSEIRTSKFPTPTDSHPPPTPVLLFRLQADESVSPAIADASSRSAWTLRRLAVNSGASGATKEVRRDCRPMHLVLRACPPGACNPQEGGLYQSTYVFLPEIHRPPLGGWVGANGRRERAARSVTILVS